MKNRKQIIEEIISPKTDSLMVIWVHPSANVKCKRLTPDEAEKYKGVGKLAMMIKFEGDDETDKVPVLIETKDFKINYLYNGKDEK